jgi:hypothetical protein
LLKTSELQRTQPASKEGADVVTTARTASKGLVLALAVVSALLVFGVRQFTDAHFFCYAIVGVLSCIGVGWLASLMIPGPRKDITGLTIYSRRKGGTPSVRSDAHSFST